MWTLDPGEGEGAKMLQQVWLWSTSLIKVPTVLLLPLPCGIKSATLGLMLSSGTSKTKQLAPVKLDFPLFLTFHCLTCGPAWLILYHVTPPAHSKGVFTGIHFQPLGGEMHCGRKVPCHANEYNDPGPVSARTQTALNPEFNALIFIHHVFLSQFIEERDTEHKRKWKHNAAPLAGSPYN